MAQKSRVIYYQDEQKDDFSKAKITPRVIDEHYVYLRTSRRSRWARFFWYRVVAMPLAFLYTKLVLGHRIVHAERLKPFGKTGYFLYGNHTQAIGDALIPHLLYPRQATDMIVHADNVSMPILGRLTPYLGALPLPDDRKAYRHFMQALDTRLKQGTKIVIYPEAHIWPYYTGIRSFSDASFQYPLKYGTPAFCLTNTYQKRRLCKRPRIVTYVDGPFYPDKSLPERARRKDLRDRIYACMTARAATSEVAWIRYIPKQADNGETS